MKILLIILLLTLTPITASAEVVEEVATAQNGVVFVRLHNYLSRHVSCYYKDDYNYFTFVIPAQTTTPWQPIYGTYIWECS